MALAFHLVDGLLAPPPSSRRAARDLTVGGWFGPAHCACCGLAQVLWGWLAGRRRWRSEGPPRWPSAQHRWGQVFVGALLAAPCLCDGQPVGDKACTVGEKRGRARSLASTVSRRAPGALLCEVEGGTRKWLGTATSRLCGTRGGHQEAKELLFVLCRQVFGDAWWRSGTALLDGRSLASRGVARALAVGGWFGPAQRAASTLAHALWFWWSVGAEKASHARSRLGGTEVLHVRPAAGGCVGAPEASHPQSPGAHLVLFCAR